MQALINKDALSAICQTKEVTTKYIAEKANLELTKVERWLNPQDTLLPTFNQAKEIAKCLHVPFAGLYMKAEDLPIDTIRKHKIRNYRKMQEGYSIDDSAVNIAISDLIQAKNFLLSCKTELGERIQIFNIGFAPYNDSVSAWGAEIRKIFSFDLEEQFRFSSTRKLYLYIRNLLEDKELFVHCFTDVAVEVMRGTAIFNEDIPIIGINEKDRHPAKSFSMIHELVHIMKRQSSMCNEMSTSFSGNAEEVFCNAVAGECLVPSDVLTNLLRSRKSTSEYSIKDIKEIADVFSVSKEVITRRLFDCDKISKSAYDTYILELNRLFLLEKESAREEARIAKEQGRPTGFPIRPDYKAIEKTSSSICKTLYNGYCEEYFSKQDVARYLGMNQKYVDKFFKEVSAWQ